MFKKTKLLHTLSILATAAIVIPIVALIILTINYGVRQKYAEHRIARIAWSILSSQNNATEENLATIMGIAHKESRFWSAAVGRGHEVGVMQISESLARQYGLVITPNARKSTPLQKGLSLPPTEVQLKLDQRFNELTSIKITIDHFIKLKRSFQKNYNIEESEARDLAVLAINIGEESTKTLLINSKAKNVSSALDILAQNDQPKNTWFRRAVAISYTEHVLNYRSQNSKNLMYGLHSNGPSFGEIFQDVAETPKEFYTRIFLDWPELERAMNSRRPKAGTVLNFNSSLSYNYLKKSRKTVASGGSFG